jgi:hypothetical protein
MSHVQLGPWRDLSVYGVCMVCGRCVYGVWTVCGRWAHPKCVGYTSSEVQTAVKLMMGGRDGRCASNKSIFKIFWTHAQREGPMQ